MKRNMQPGGASTRPGFTLIELLIVVVIIGILASVAMAKYGKVREAAFLSTLKSDIELLAKHQEIYHLHHLQYGDEANLTDFEASPGVNVDIGYAAGDGWGGSATHSALPGVTCGILVGNATAGSGGPATVRDVLTCN
ncbi:MAG TPA: prepilin-type N-terminal cleavage/methylation domain-containing protein [Longimicrobiales bacterium]|nr:prepilin-type N-terminal cleavage/methylation domain-containing protein [Longimicrobiales bacterium]